ncbi:MAG: SpoIIE family protein phosphatase [Clostridia bacterium]|nr:SpoIIE family protein phosphatase [Clostridia bacterium]
MNKTKPKLKEKLRTSKEWRSIAQQCILFVLGFFLTPVKFIFDIYPFSLALLASCKGPAPFVFAGSLLSVYFNLDMDISYALALCALMALRIVGSLWLSGGTDNGLGLNMENRRDLLSSFFGENEGVRVALCAVSALGISVYKVVMSDFSYYEIFVLAFFVIISSVLTYTLCGIYSQGSSTIKSAGVCVLSFMVIFALKGRELFDLDISIILSYCLVLYTSKTVSPAKGGAFGALLGICQRVGFAPIFSIASLVSGFLWRTSAFLAVISAFTVSVGYGVFTSGYEALVYLVPELLLSTLIMYPILKFEVLPRPRFATLPKEGTTVKEVLSKEKGERIKNGFLRVSDSLHEVSKLLYEFGSSEKAVSMDSRYESCLEICENNCYSCPKRGICWDRDSATTKENIDKLSTASYYNKSVSKSDIDEKFLHRCPNIDTIIEKINEKCKLDEEALSKNDKLEISGADYENFSKLLSKEAQRIEDEDIPDPVLTDKLVRLADSLGLICTSISAFGGAKKRIIATGVDVESSKCNSSVLTNELERVLGCKITPPKFEGESPYSVMTVESANRYAIESAKLSGKADEAQQNGDTVSTFLSYDNKFYMLICDGMGSGKEASATSLVCAEFLKRLLSLHPDKEVSLSMVNNFLRHKRAECSSSVDLLEIDLADGKSSFIKSGAAPSFVKRGDKVFKLFSKTAPIGIMKNPDAEQLDFNLQEGDIVVMVSDGICATESDSEWICSLLSSSTADSIDTLPSKIINRSRERSFSSDDKTVSACVVKSAVI